jgi:acetolactate synthase-1/2/3 large subunit
LRAWDGASATPRNLDAWWKEIRSWQERYPLVYDEPLADGPLRPQHIIKAIAASAEPGTIVSAGVGQHQMWVSQFWKFEEPGTWINSGGAGTMGFGVPAAIGAKVGRPERTVWCIDGDGCFQMTAQELVTARCEGIPIKVAILNNAHLGMVRQWQEMFYDERYSEVYLSADLPDYVKWAEAMGCAGLRARNLKEMREVIDEANSINDVPVVIDFRTDASEKVFPMVTAGASNDDIQVHPLQRGALR